MRKFAATLITLATLASACQTPAYAEEPKPDLPLPAMAAEQAAPRISLSQRNYQVMVQTLAMLQVEAARTCATNSKLWFCGTEELLKAVQEDAKPVKENHDEKAADK